jgi:hypothetical protein
MSKMTGGARLGLPGFKTLTTGLKKSAFKEEEKADDIEASTDTQVSAVSTN